MAININPDKLTDDQKATAVKEAKILINGVCEIGKMLCSASLPGLAMTAANLFEMAEALEEMIEKEGEKKEVDQAGLAFIQSCCLLACEVMEERQSKNKVAKPVQWNKQTAEDLN